MNIYRGITHCDTIGDIFQNPILLKFIRDWYELKNEWQMLQVRRNIRWEKTYTPEFYDFIRVVFENRTDMEAFLDYVREMVLTSEKISRKLFWRHGDWDGRKYGNQDIIKALLAFDELNDQLSTVTWLTIAWVFQTRVIDIVRNAMNADAHNEESDETDDEDTPVYPKISLYYALEKTLEDGVFPINSDGEIICKIADGVVWSIINVIWRNEMYEVDKLGNRTDRVKNIIEIEWEEIFDTREKIVARIKLLEKILRYHLIDDVEISEEEEQYYADLWNIYESNLIAKQKTSIGDAFYHGFTRHIISMIEELSIKLRNTEPSDTLMIQPLLDVGITPGVTRELPKAKASLQNQPSQWEKPTLRIV